MIVVSDTSPLGSLALIDHLWLLQNIYGTVIIPDNEGFHRGQWTLSFIELVALVRDIAHVSQEFIDLHPKRRQ